MARRWALKSILTTDWGTGRSRHRAGPRRTAAAGGSWFNYDPFAKAGFGLPHRRRGRKRSISRKAG